MILMFFPSTGGGLTVRQPLSGQHCAVQSTSPSIFDILIPLWKSLWHYQGARALEFSPKNMTQSLTDTLIGVAVTVIAAFVLWLIKRALSRPSEALLLARDAKKQTDRTWGVIDQFRSDMTDVKSEISSMSATMTATANENSRRFDDMSERIDHLTNAVTGRLDRVDDTAKENGERIAALESKIQA